MDELFKTASVILKDKKGIVFDSCAVQANPDLPEDVWRLVESALFRAEGGAESIVELIRYYRGNRLVVQAIEELFRERGISLRKSEIYEKVLPKRYASLLKARGGDEAALKKAIDARVSLFQLFRVLGRYQDRLKDEAREKREKDAFKKRPEGLGAFADRAEKRFHEGRSRREREAYFEEVLLPFVFFSIESTVLEYAKRRTDTVKTA
jgi:adenylate cyclase